jgi:hypothetical protein
MLNPKEIEQLLVENTGLFTPSQLVSLLLAVCKETTSLAPICDKILCQFKADVSTLSAAAAGTSGDHATQSQEVAAVIEAWTQLLDMAAALKPDRRYILLQLALDILAVMQPEARPPTLLLVEMISSDLTQQHIKQKDLRVFLKCLLKLSAIDRASYAQLIGELEEHFVGVTSNDICLNIFVEEADHLSPEVSNLFFAKAVEAFNNQKASSKLARLWNYVVGGNEDSHAKTQNLARLFSHCVRETNIDGLGAAKAFAVITGLPALANMMKFLPQLRKLGCLGADIERKAGLIINHVTQVNSALAEGRVSLHLVQMLRDEQRVERLLTLSSSLQEPPNNWQLRSCINLRSEELAEYHKAADDIRKFADKFPHFQGSEMIGDILAQFAQDPERVEMRQVCNVRKHTTGRIELKLRGVSSEDLEQVRMHNDLYNSAVFRIIGERFCLEGTTR